MYVSVGKGGMPAAEFTVGSLLVGRLANGNPTVGAQVRNTGPAALDISGELSLSDGPGGLSAGPFPITLGTMLAPSHSVIERVALDGEIPKGPWRAELRLSSDGTQRSSIATITFPTGSVAEEHSSIAALPILAALLFLALLLTTGGAVARSRRHSLRRHRSRRHRLRLV
jgi:hypothetical protein